MTYRGALDFARCGLIAAVLTYHLTAQPPPPTEQRWAIIALVAGLSAAAFALGHVARTLRQALAAYAVEVGLITALGLVARGSTFAHRTAPGEGFERETVLPVEAASA